MTDDEDKPTMWIQTDDATIHVNDRKTAEMALKIIDHVLSAHLNETTDVERNRGRKVPKQYQPAPVQCDSCGYEWYYQGANPKSATCSDCNSHVKIDPPLTERGLR